jgi:ribonucleoside-diphosphate reductase beta chain
MTVDTDPEARIGGDSRSYRYYRNAVERHWDPHAIDLSEDRVRIARLDDPGFENLRRTLALFGAGEEAVTSDLAPLAAVLDDVNDQLFVASQTYEEAKHADFFHRYWETVIADEEHARGNDISSPTDDRWFSEPYHELFDRTEDAMNRLLTEDTPENRASAYCHYHMTVEGILAQTGYYGVQTTFSGEVEETPELPGLVEGFSKIRSDEGRHVGFGMAKLKELVESGGVSASFLRDTVGELVQLTQAIVTTAQEEIPEAEVRGPTSEELAAYAAQKHTDRMRQITTASEDVPGVEELVRID